MSKFQLNSICAILFLFISYFSFSQSIQKLLTINGDNAWYWPGNFAKANNGNLITGGSYQPDQNILPVLAQYTLVDSNLNILWSKTLGTTPVVPLLDFRNLTTTSDSGFVFLGAIFTDTSSIDYYDVCILKTDINGNVQWLKSYGGDKGDHGLSIIETKGGKLIVAGTTKSFLGNAYAYYLFCTDINGDTLWTKTLGDSYTYFGNIVNSSDSNYLFIGSVTEGPLVVKINGDGDTLWTKIYKSGYDISPDTIGFAEGKDIFPTSDGGYIVTARADEGYEEKILLIKTDSAGKAKWAKIYTPTTKPNALPTRIQQSKDGGYLVTGCVNCYMFNNSRIFLMKTDSNGVFQWGATYGQNANSSIFYKEQNALSISQLPGNKIIIGGTTNHFNDKMEGYLIKTDSVSVANSTGCFEQKEVFTEKSVGVKTAKGVKVGYTQTLVKNINYQYLNLPIKDSLLCKPNTINELIQSNEYIKLYPNPAHNQFYISGNFPLPATLELYDIIGRKTLAKPISAYPIQVTISTLNRGLYFYRLITAEGKIQSGKLAVE